MAEQATNTDISVGDDGCVTGFQAREGKGFETLQERFGKLVEDEATFSVQFASGNEISNFNPDNRTATINPLDLQRKRYISGGVIACMFGGSGTGTFSSKAIFTHELIGHGSGMAGGGRPSTSGVWAENIYHAAVGERRRCGEGS